MATEYLCLTCREIQTLDEISEGHCSYCQHTAFFEREALPEIPKIPLITMYPVSTAALEAEAKKVLERMSNKESA